MFAYKTALFVALAALTGSTLAQDAGVVPEQGAQSPRVQLDQQQVYTCSMHPQIRSTDPNERCPICGMALIPVEGGHDHSGEIPELTLSPRALALLNVTTSPVIRSEIHHTVRLNGTLDYDQSRVKTLSAWVPGRLDKIHVDYTGAVVSQGDRLADIYSPDLLTAQSELFRARRLTQPGGDQSTLRAARTRLRLLGLNNDHIAEMERHGEVRDHLPLRATLSGTVLERQAVEGAYVNTGDPLYTIADLSVLWAVLEVYERDLAGIEAGQPVTLSTAALPGVELEGEVLFIEPSVRMDTRTTAVRVALENPEGRLKPGMLARASIQIEQPQGLLIPASAPLLAGHRQLVYVRDPEMAGRFTPRDVKLGPKVSGYYPVLDGLHEGELVVSQGAFRLDSELQIRGLPSMMAPEGNAAPSHNHGDHQPHAPAPEAPVQSIPASAHQLDWQPVFRHYHAAQQALANDDFESWQTATRELQEAVETLAWPDTMADLRNALLKGAGHIHHVADLDAAQTLFYDHAQAMIALARQGLGPNTSYVFFCPMARNDEGAHWLQANDQLRNPYFGSMMLRCGELTETLEQPGGPEGHRHD